MSDRAVNWKLDGNHAHLSCGPLSGTVTVDQANASFVVEQWSERPVSGLTVLAYSGLDFVTESLAETYIRGGDFVATFTESRADRVAPQLYWRALFVKEFRAAQIELIVSVRTNLLDSSPASRAHSLVYLNANPLHATSLDAPHFDGIEMFPVRPGEIATWRPVIKFDTSKSRQHLFVFRIPEHGLSFAQMVHPSDFVAAELAADMQLNYSLSATLFPERLEKGVIRRGRICGWFMPAENDLETAVQLARQFVDEPLPLTT